MSLGQDIWWDLKTSIRGTFNFVTSVPCAVYWRIANAVETGARIQELLSTASSKGICGKDLMAAAVASLQAPAEASAAIPREDKLLVRVRGLPCLDCLHGHHPVQCTV